MTAERLAAMHRLLAEYHRKLATEALLDVVQQYPADLAQRLADGRDRLSCVRLQWSDHPPYRLVATALSRVRLRKQAGIGGLLSYGINPPDQLRRAGDHVRRILDGEKSRVTCQFSCRSNMR